MFSASKTFYYKMCVAIKTLCLGNWCQCEKLDRISVRLKTFENPGNLRLRGICVAILYRLSRSRKARTPWILELLTTHYP